MKVRFPYEPLGDTNFGEMYRPVAKITFYSPTQKSRATSNWLIVDTGADFTILACFMAADLGIDLKKDCIKDETSGIGGTQTVYLYKGKLKAKIGDISLEIPVGFWADDLLPSLMGRHGCLELYETTFVRNEYVEIYQPNPIIRWIHSFLKA